ncbi:hypothetical protein GDI3584 [Gluconacetobacter diazotrophicus PA1 5]|uniref:Uncharacterized protein n=1 Tax=Gluconacetobacter diazotrophicus (strain ATCC 49037 / DSM 5601 / CCUG 37298 / CIP 103539 / LMG 7603 / PAl5) TaxID=272568 RepID=A9H6P3_GLUDA|nr:hypothetical protein GDI3584 [Gluconacetobacter diazotrophicus PA1 5]
MSGLEIVFIYIPIRTCNLFVCYTDLCPHGDRFSPRIRHHRSHGAPLL